MWDVKSLSPAMQNQQLKLLIIIIKKKTPWDDMIKFWLILTSNPINNGLAEPHIDHFKYMFA